MFLHIFWIANFSLLGTNVQFVIIALCIYLFLGTQFLKPYAARGFLQKKNICSNITKFRFMQIYLNISIRHANVQSASQ